MNENKTNNNTHIEEDSDTQASLAKLKMHITRSSLAKSLLLKGENLRKFEDFRAKILKEMGPQTHIEDVLCEKFITSAWKHTRCLEIERNMLNALNVPGAEKTPDEEELLYFSLPKKRRVRNIKAIRLGSLEVQKLLKYQLELEKAMNKALELFRAEQRLREPS